MTLRTQVHLPAIGPIRWRKDGYGTQVITMPAAGTCANHQDQILGEVVPRDPIQRGYVKIWVNPAKPRVADRALTVRGARKRITRLKQNLEEMVA